MISFRPRAAVLCLYEAARLFLITGAFAHSQAGAATSFPILPLLTPGALFFLMSLFWLLDAPGHRAYGPLFLTGKALGVITAAIWILLADDRVAREFADGAERLVASGVSLFLIPGDILSAWLALGIMRRQAGG